jgi:hypothetical protein
VRLFDTVFSGEDLGLILRTKEGLAIWGSTDASYRQLWSRFVNDVDWEGDRGRWWFDYAVYDRRTTGAETFLVTGFLSERGTFDPRLMYRGSIEARANNPGCAWPSPPAHAVEGLSQLPPASIVSPRGPVGFDRSAGGGPLRIQGSTYARGIGMTPPCTVTWNIGGHYSSFRARIGLQRTGPGFSIRADQERVRFEVIVDADLIYQSDVLSSSAGTRDVAIDVIGARSIQLRAVPTTTQLWHYGPVGWADARLGVTSP